MRGGSALPCWREWLRQVDVDQDRHRRLHARSRSQVGAVRRADQYDLAEQGAGTGDSGDLAGLGAVPAYDRGREHRLRRDGGRCAAPFFRKPIQGTREVGAGSIEGAFESGYAIGRFANRAASDRGYRTGLIGEARLVFMDEPTASLTQSETDALLEVVRTLSAQGIAVVFVSHRLAEVIDISERVTVLRDGQLVGVFATEGMTQFRLGELMTGAQLENVVRAEDRSGTERCLRSRG